MADELAALFASITTSDHDDLVRQFARILRTDEAAAKFFLESSNWNVEAAVNTYLTTLGGEGGLLLSSISVPQGAFVGGAECLNARPFPPGAQITMSWSFKNTGTTPWPVDARLVHTEGERLGAPPGFHVAAHPGHTTSVTIAIRAPPAPGAYASTWRLACSTGYFGDPVWIILSVAPDAATPATPASPAGAFAPLPHATAPTVGGGAHSLAHSAFMGPGSALVAQTVSESRAPRGLLPFVAPHTTAAAPVFTTAPLASPATSSAAVWGAQPVASSAAPHTHPASGGGGGMDSE